MGLPVVLYCTLTANAFHLSPRSAAGVSCHPLIPRKDAEKEKRALIQIPRGARSRSLAGWMADAAAAAQALSLALSLARPSIVCNLYNISARFGLHSLASFQQYRTSASY
jgi:hypothetical protein